MSFFSDLFGGGGSQQGSSTVIQQASSEPFSEQKPFLSQRFRQAGQLAGGTDQIDQGKLLEHLKTSGNPLYGEYLAGGAQDLVASSKSVLQDLAANNPEALAGMTTQKNMAEYFPGQTFVNFAPETQEAMGGLADQARATDPMLEAARGQAQSTVQGDFLSAGNPYFQNMAQSIGNTVQPQVQSRFGVSGRGGSGAENSEFTRIMADALAPLQYQNYETERGRQNTAMMTAPQNFFGQDQQRLGQLANVGGAREQKAAEALGDQINRFNFDQNRGQRELDLLSQYTGGTYGGSSSSSSTQPIFGGSPLAGMMGTGMAVAGMGNDFGWWGD
jgi:hypothetical protein